MEALQYNGQRINQRDSDGYVNLGQLCATHGKKLNDWSRLNASKAYLKALYLTTGIPVADLIIIQNGNATWGHPLVAIEVARWISPSFGVWCNLHIKTLIETGKTEIPNQGTGQESRQLPPAPEYEGIIKLLPTITDPIIKSALTQRIAEELSGTSQEDRDRPVLVSVVARQMGYSCSPPVDSVLGKYVAARVPPAGKTQHGKYPVNVYRDTDKLRETIKDFYSDR